MAHRPHQRARGRMRLPTRTLCCALCLPSARVLRPDVMRSALILSDEHPNVVRCFAMEEDSQFVYLALERCKCTLHDELSSPEGGAGAYLDADGLPTQHCWQACGSVKRTACDVCLGFRV
jgi:hypothetical protein